MPSAVFQFFAFLSGRHFSGRQVFRFLRIFKAPRRRPWLLDKKSGSDSIRGSFREKHMLLPAGGQEIAFKHGSDKMDLSQIRYYLPQQQRAALLLFARLARLLFQKLKEMYIYLFASSSFAPSFCAITFILYIFSNLLHHRTSFIQAYKIFCTSIFQYIFCHLSRNRPVHLKAFLPFARHRARWLALAFAGRRRRG